MDLPEIVSTEEWKAARAAFLVREKDVTHTLDDVAAERRRLPAVEVSRDYVFEGSEGR